MNLQPITWNTMHNLSPNYREEHFPFGEGWGLRDEKLANYPRDSTIYRQQRSEYYAMITHLDDQIRIMLDSLGAMGLLENTYIYSHEFNILNISR